MSEKLSTSKVKPAPAKPAARKSATAKPAPTKATVATKPGKKTPEKKDKKTKKVNVKAETKVKVIRDSFTMPQNDYAKIVELKQVCQKAGLQVKKSELLRAGLHALAKLSAAQLKQTITQMEQIKTGRPKKS
jgi:hypothetical protein